MEFPARLRALLVRHGDGALARAEEFIEDVREPCVYVTSRRLTTQPLRKSNLHQLLGHSAAPPSLSMSASKFGGMPFSAINISKGSLFVGQINFGAMPFELPKGPREGLLEIYVDPTPADKTPSGFRLRWHPRPEDAESSSWRAPPQSFGSYEAEMVMTQGYSLPSGERWASAVSSYNDAELSAEWATFTPAHYNDDLYRGDCHRLFGHRTAGLEIAEGLGGERGVVERVREHEVIMRLVADREADFAWGGKTMYVLIDKDDLNRGRMERALVVTSAR